MEIRTEAIALKGQTASQKGEVYFQSLSPGDRGRRAAKILLLCWGLAVVTLFIPIAHFFLVPFFTIAGPVMATLKYRQALLAERAEGECPECGERVCIALEPGDKIPKWTYCPLCSKPLQLVYHEKE